MRKKGSKLAFLTLISISLVIAALWAITHSGTPVAAETELKELQILQHLPKPQATGGCESLYTALDVILVIDRSGSMDGKPLDDAKEAAKTFVDLMNLSLDQAGIASFSSSASLDHQLSHNRESIKQAIDSLGAGGSTAIGAGLQTAFNELRSNRHNPNAYPLIILLSDGENNEPPDPVEVANQIKQAGIRIITIGLGDSVDENLLRTIASSPNDYYYSPTPEALAQIYQSLAILLCRGVVISDYHPRLLVGTPELGVTLTVTVTTILTEPGHIWVTVIQSDTQTYQTYVSLTHTTAGVYTDNVTLFWKPADYDTSYIILARVYKFGDLPPQAKPIMESNLIVPFYYSYFGPLTLKGLMVLQIIQNLNNEIPLITGKHTYVIPFFSTYKFPLFIPRDQIMLKVRKNGQLIDVYSLAGDLRLSNVNSVSKEEWFHHAMNEGQYFEIDPYKLTGDVELGIEISDPRYNLQCDEQDGDHDCRVTVYFTQSVTLPLVIVPSTLIPDDKEIALTIISIEQLFPVEKTNIKIVPAYLVAEFRIDMVMLIRLLEGKPLLYLHSRCASVLPTGHVLPTGLGILGVGAWACSSIVDERGHVYLSSIIPAHELGHVFGLSHVSSNGECQLDPMPWSVDTHFPNPNGHISPVTSKQDLYKAIWGYRYLEGSRVYPPADYDMMTYCDNRLISDYHYKKLLKTLNEWFSSSGEAVFNESNGSQKLVLTGMITRTLLYEGGIINNLKVITDSSLQISPCAEGDYEVTLKDASDKVLLACRFTPQPFHIDPSYGDEQEELVYLVLPWDSKIHKVVLSHKGRILATKEASANYPVISLLNPQGGETVSGGVITFTWTAYDIDGDELQYELDYSQDGGNTWFPIALGPMPTQTQRLTIPWELLPGSSYGLFRVSVNDGFHTSYDSITEAIVIYPHAPAVSIIKSFPQDIFVGDQLIVLRGISYDLEDGELKNDALQWFSNRNGFLGNGSYLAIKASDLEEGTHVITLMAEDSQGLTATESITIEVYHRRPFIPPTLSAGPRYINFEAVSGFITGVMTDAILIMNVGDGSLAWEAAADQPWINLSFAQGKAPTYTLVTVNPQGLPEGFHTGHITITAPGARNSPVSIEVRLYIRPPYGIYLPMILRDYATIPKGPELVVKQVMVNPSQPAPGQPITITITIANEGEQDTPNGFWVDLYIDPIHPPSINELWEDLCTYGAAWYVPAIPAGGSVTLTTEDVYEEYSNFPGYLTEGTHTIYVQVDSYNNVGNAGLVEESDETNNVYGPVTVQVGAGGAVIPQGPAPGRPRVPRATPTPTPGPGVR